MSEPLFAPIDYGNIETALRSPAGWMELAIVAACFGVAWYVDRRQRRTAPVRTGIAKVGMGGITRVVLPVTALVLLAIAYSIYRHYHPPFFIAIALPLTVALAVIRLLVYALRGLFGTPPWMPVSERVISFTIWGLVLLYFTGVLPEVRSALGEMEIPLGSGRITLLEVLRSTLVVALTVAVTVWLSGLIEERISRAQHVDTNLRAVLGKFVRALLLVIGILFALQAVGIDLTLLSVFGGALGVGIGLGLQKLASNYIAGFTILLDRSIRVGDMITVDGRHGFVSRVTARYVVVKSLDGVEAIVPNETLATTTVLNHTYSDKNVRVAVPVQISYDSDLDRAIRLMVEAAAVEPRVKKVPGPPDVFVVRFGESGIELELGFWIDDPENGSGGLRSAINRRIWTSFKANNIRIPVMQRAFRIADGGGGDVPALPAPVPASGALPARTVPSPAAPPGSVATSPPAPGRGA